MNNGHDDVPWRALAFLLVIFMLAAMFDAWLK